MIKRTFALAILASPLLFSQSLGIDLTPKAKLAEVAIFDEKGNQVVPDETDKKSVSTITVPIVGIKAKINFVLPKDLPQINPSKFALGKINPEKTGGVRLAKLIVEEDKAILKAKIRFSLSIDDDCEPFKESERPKAKLDENGVWILEIPKALEPGIYCLVAATGSAGMFGAKVDAKARIFQVPSAPVVPADGAQ